MTQANSILRVKNPSKADFVELWKQGKPFIINGIANNWDAHLKWSNDYLVKSCGNSIIPVEVYGSNFAKNYNFTREDSYRPQKMRFRDYIDIISGKRQNDDFSYYMAQVDFKKYLPQLMKDINLPIYFRKKPKIIFFFFGFSNQNSTSRTYLHFDEIHNIFVQIRGKKRFLLFSPNDYRSFYPPLEDNGCSPAWSKVNPDNSKRELFPKFPWQEKIEVILEAGEILYIPPFWWHYVTALNENISLTFWYPPNIKDFFIQKGILSAFLQMAPHVIPHFVFYKIRKTLKNNPVSKMLVKKYLT